MPIVLVALGLALFAGWAAMPWEWSLVDDADYKLKLLIAQEDHGWLGGIVERVDYVYQGDLAGGQFRPFLWVYSGTFYLFGTGLAHAVRLLLTLVALISVGVAVRQRLAGAVDPGRTWLVTIWAVAAVASIRGLYDGLSFLSIMELPTITFAALALVDRSATRKVMWLTLASLCKTPVVGGLFALALVLYRRGRRGLAVAAAIISVVIVLFAQDFARGGVYTAQYQLTLAHAVDTLVGLGRQLALPVLVLAFALVWVRTWRLRFDDDAFVLGAAGLGYVVLLLPWGSSSGYNLAAPAFLLVSCAVLVVTMTLRATWAEETPVDGEPAARGPIRDVRRLAPVVVALLVAGFVATIGVKAALDRDETIRGVVSWADALPKDEVVATNGIESSVRYDQLISLRHGRRESERFEYAQPGGPPPCGVTWVVAMHDQGPHLLDAQLTLERSLPGAEIYRVAGPGGTAPVC